MNGTASLFEMEQRNSTLIISPQANLSELEFEAINEAVEAAMKILDQSTIKDVILDCTHSDYFGSTALGFFVRLWKRVKERKGRMVLCHLSPHERDILQAAQLDKLWPVHDSREDAMKALHGAPRE
jgi:anti-anti-sigma factor